MIFTLNIALNTLSTCGLKTLNIFSTFAFILLRKWLRMSGGVKSKLGRNPCKARCYDLIVWFQLLRINPRLQPAPNLLTSDNQLVRYVLSTFSQQILAFWASLRTFLYLVLYCGLSNSNYALIIN